MIQPQDVYQECVRGLEIVPGMRDDVRTFLRRYEKALKLPDKDAMLALYASLDNIASSENAKERDRVVCNMMLWGLASVLKLIIVKELE